jgi:hypothetical protein
MNPSLGPRKVCLVSKVLITTLLCLLGLLGALSYTLLDGGQMAQSPYSRSTAFQVAQFKADVRTVAGAISYLLEPEPGNTATNSDYSPDTAALPAALRKVS